MKKLFSLIGIFIGIHMIYLFLMYSNGIIFPNNVGNLYDCSVDKNISSDDLTKLAKKYDLTAFTNVYNNVSFGKEDIVFTYLNISKNDDIKMGYQNTLLPDNKILYKTSSETKTMIHRFWVITNKNSNLKSFIEELSDYKISHYLFETREMKFYVIFTPVNIIFFIYVLLLFLFCTSTYYMLRSKEVAILKLNGYNNFYISANIIKIGSIRLLLGYTLILLPLCIYLAIKHNNLLKDFFKLYFYITFCIVVMILFIMLIGVFFVKYLNIVTALKNNKNNKLLITFIIIFKLCATIILIISAKNVYYDILDLQVTKTYNNNINSNDFYYIQTSCTPDDKLMNIILTKLEELDNDEIYNYSYATDNLYGHESVLNTRKKRLMYDDPPRIRMSYSMLDIIPIYSDKNKLIKKSDLNENANTLLIPSNLTEKTEEIVSYYSAYDNIKVRYIKSGQEHYDFLFPHSKVYNAIYFLHAPVKHIYYRSGETIFRKEVAENIKKYLSDNKIDSGSVSLVNLSSNYDIGLSNIKLKLGDDIKFLIINGLSFMLSVIAIGIAFCEFRKKEIAVFKIVGIFPLRLILSLCLVNIFITFFVTIFICPILSFVPALEIIPYILIFSVYKNKKTTAVLKGE